jgi:DNA-binding IclR family transcriptional regulator
MDLGFSVRVGYRRRLIDTNSGALYFGLAAADIRKNWFTQLSATANADDLERFQARVETGLQQGYIKKPSDFVDGVMDFCVPIVTLQGPVAVLIVPFIHIKAQIIPEEKVLESLQRTTEKIAHDLLD